MWPRSSEGGTSPIRRMPAFTGAPLAGLAQETATCRAFPGVPAGQGGGCAFSGRLPKRIPKGKCETCSRACPGSIASPGGRPSFATGIGARVSLAITINRRFNVGARSFSGNPCGGGARTGAGRHPGWRRPDVAVVDRGCRGHHCVFDVWPACRAPGITPSTLHAFKAVEFDPDLAPDRAGRDRCLWRPLSGEGVEHMLVKGCPAPS